MNPFGELFAHLEAYVGPFAETTQRQSVDAFAAYLTGDDNPVIRMWADGTPGDTAVASTVALLRQLVAPNEDNGFGYAGTIEVYYAAGATGDPTLPKLQRQLPELGTGHTGAVGQATVELRAWPAQAPQQPVNLGFTGCAINPTDSTGSHFAGRLQTRCLLRLQPYLTGEPEEIQFLDQPDGSISLTAQKALGYGSFRQRAYYATDVTEPDWESYADGAYAAEAELVKILTDEDANWGLATVTGLRTTGMQPPRPAPDRVFEVITAALAAQRDPDGSPAAAGQPIVVVCCDDFGTMAERAELRDLLQGRYSQAEQEIATVLEADEALPEPLLEARRVAQLQDALKGRRFRAEWLDSVDALERITLQWTVDAQALDRHLDWLVESTDRVLFVRLGAIPQPLIDWCASKGGFPGVVTDPASANAALNLGTPYLHVTRPGFAGAQYPATVVGYEGYDPGTPYLPRIFLSPQARRVQETANALTVPLSQWSPEENENPAERVGALAREYAEEGDDGPLHRYFGGLKAFYAGALNDKLRTAAGFLQHVLSGQDAGSPAQILGQLYQSLLNNTTGTTIRVAPGALNTGEIFRFYTLFQPQQPTGLVLTNASPPEQVFQGGALALVRVRGTATFDGVALSAVIEFTAPHGVIVADARYGYAPGWAPADIPWVTFASSFVDILTPDAALPPVAAVGGVLDGTTIEVAYRLPSTDGVRLLAGAWTAAAHQPESVFGLAGGVDLIRSLPSPVDGLVGFNLRNVQLTIDDGSVETAGFRFTTDDGFALTGGVSVDDITADVVVQYPADLSQRQTQWTVRGRMRIGSGTVVLTAVGPDLVLTGSLVSGEVGVNELINLFAPPGTTLVPPSGAVPVVSAFQSSFTPDTGDYEVLCQLNFSWPLSIMGTLVFTVQDIGFAARRISGLVTGQLTGHVVIGSGDDAVPFSLTADYAGGWTFRVVQPPERPLKLSTLASSLVRGLVIPADEDPLIADVALTVGVDAGTWEVSGRTALNNDLDVDFLGLSLAASLRLGYRAEGSYGRLEAEVTWHGMELTAFYEYGPSAQDCGFGMRWGVLEAAVEPVEGKEGVCTATLRLTEETTVGSMIETMVSWATGAAYGLEAPWSVLSAIPLSGLALTWTFHTSPSTGNDTVAFTVDIGPIDLGFGRIDRIGVVYDDKGEQRVAVTLEGSFLWNTGDDAVGDPSRLGPWDTTRPGTAPAPPGLGDKYVDIRMLALGQHVTVEGMDEASTVTDAIALMRTLPEPDPDTVPTTGGVVFDGGVGWMIGADLGILRFEDDSEAGGGYLLTTQFVFNDPRLYALRLALAGDAAKVFQGLDFQLMYRQVSDTVGVYQSELTLPDAMRHLTVGGYSLTLPVVAVAVYTNGDFQVDLGFPWGGDFTRSFTVEAIIAGVPVVGSAGIYFGKLSDASTSLVPAVTNGTFNPVLVFGFGMQVGFGKTVEYGVLSGGFSLTIAGIIEGVLAAFNPYQPQETRGSSPAQLQDGYYFWLRGTLGIAGRLYGTLDFSVVKAEVNVAISLMLQITYESYVSLAITVIVAVDVSVTVTIDLGVFRIRLAFSFSMRIQETFSIDNGGTPPWITAGTPGGWLSGPADRRLGHRRRPPSHVLDAVAGPDRWQQLLPSERGPMALQGWIAPSLTVAHDEHDATNDPTRQVACYVLLSFLETMPDTGTDLAAALEQAAGAADTAFESLAKMVLRWAIATTFATKKTPEQIDGERVSEAALSLLLDQVLVSTDNEPVPIRPSDVETFLLNQFRILFNPAEEHRQQTVNATPFPMPPGMELTVPPYGSGYPGYSYRFSEYNAIDDVGLTALRAYFDELAVMAGGRAEAARTAAGGSMSVAQWVQADYFLLLARQMVQLAKDSLRDFHYEFDGRTPVEICAEVNRIGQLTGDDQIDVAGLFAANPDHPLTSAVRKPLAGLSMLVGSGDSFDSLALDLSLDVTPIALATANAANRELLRPGARIVYRGTAYEVLPDDSLIEVAGRAGARFGDFLSGSPGLFDDEAIFKDGGKLTAPLLSAQCLAGDTFTTIAQRPAYRSTLPNAPVPEQGFSPYELALANAGRAVLRIGATVELAGGEKYQVQANDTLADVAVMLGLAIQDLCAREAVLKNSTLLAPAAVLVVPPFAFQVGASDTLGGLTTRFATTLAVLARANADIPLFANKDAAGTEVPYLHVPHLAQYRVAEILDEIKRTLGLQQVSRIAARYSMHGMRLPTNGIVAKQRGMWVGPDLRLPEFAGLYALTGQQIPLPPDTLVEIKLSCEFVPWAKTPAGTWMVLVTGANDISRAKYLLHATRMPFPMGLTALGAAPMDDQQPASFPFTSATTWQPAGPITLPYRPAYDRDLVQTLRLWAVPAALAALPGPPGSGRTNPRVAVGLARYDEASGATVTSPVQSYGWATVVGFTVKRVPTVEGSPTVANTYEIVGAGGGDVVILERMVQEIGSNDKWFDHVALAYGADATTAAPTGLLSGRPEATTLGIAQVNLTTQTQPSALSAVPGNGLLNRPADLVRLLWEASITRSGGFYLFYHDNDTGRGLPARIFNDRGEAQVSLLIVYRKPLQDEDANRITGFITALLTGDAIDTSATVVYAEAAPLEQPVLSTTETTLAGLAAQTFSDVADLARANAKLTLRKSVTLTVPDVVYTAPVGGVSLADLAATYQVSVKQIQDANPDWHGLPSTVYYPAAIFLPTLSYTVMSPDMSLSQVVDLYGADLTRLAAANAHAVLFEPGQWVTITGGPMVRTATVTPGTVAVLASRPKPDPVPSSPNDPQWATRFVQNTYSLLGYRVAANAGFAGSNIGLPAGPTSPSDAIDANPGKVRLPAESSVWEYRQALPYPALHNPTDPGTTDPYRGVGSILQVDFSWQDHYGNTLVTDLSTDSANPRNQPPIVIGYTDPVIPLSQWPSVAALWTVASGSTVPVLELALTFDPGRYRGLLGASLAAKGVVEARFTNEVDESTATDVRNYSIVALGVPNPEVTILEAVLQPDKVSVHLRFEPANHYQYVLTVRGVRAAADGADLTGTAPFTTSEAPTEPGSAAAVAAADLAAYATVLTQLTDAHGMAATVTTSLLAHPVDLTGAQWTELLAWLTGSVCGFLGNRAAGQESVPPPQPHVIAIPLVTDLHTGQIFELTVDVTIRRTGGTVYAPLAACPEFRSATTAIAARTAPLDPDTGGTSLGLAAFATAFQRALSTDDYQMAVAGGINRATSSAARGTAALWAVRLGASSIAYTVTNGDAPELFAPRPACNYLVSRSGVPIYEYSQGPASSRNDRCASSTSPTWTSTRGYAGCSPLSTPSSPRSTPRPSS